MADRNIYLLLVASILLSLLTLIRISNITNVPDKLPNQSGLLSEGAYLRIRSIVEKAMESSDVEPIVSSLTSANLNNAPVLPTRPEICTNQQLFGKEHQGGWLACSDNGFQKQVKDNKCIVYSFGLGFDWSFDSALENMGCEVHGFDPSGKNWRDGMYGAPFSNVDYAKQYPSAKKYFHNWGIGAADYAIYPPGTIPQDWPGLGDPQFSSSNSEPWETKSLVRSMKDLGHFDLEKSITILKIDTEGSEWDSLVAFFYDPSVTIMISKGFIRQFLVEWHWDPDSRGKNARHEKLMRRVEELGFVPWQVTRHVGSDCCLDVSYLWIEPKK